MKPSEFNAANTALTGFHLIEASAGTGKTFSLAAAVVRLVVEENIPLRKILAVTFTNAAAAELKSRIRGFLSESRALLENTSSGKNRVLIEVLDRAVKICGDNISVKEKIEAALASIDELPVYTIHGFCRRILEQHAFECSAAPGKILETDDSSLIHDAVADYWENNFAPLNATILTGLASSFKISLDNLKKIASESIRHPQILPEIPSEMRSQYPMTSKVLEKWRICAEELNVLYESKKELLGAKGKMYPQAFASLHLAVKNAEHNLPYDIFEAVEFFSKGGTSVQILKKNEGKFGSHDFFTFCINWLRDFYQAGQFAMPDFFTGIKKYLEICKHNAGVLTYSDLISKVSDALKGPEAPALMSAVSAEYDAALIDEFQDTDPAQVYIFSRLFQKAKCFMYIGDPKQSIYRFRGADVHSYIAASNQTARQSTGKKYSLAVNFRSDKNTVESVQNVLSDENFFAAEGIELGNISSFERYGSTLRGSGIPAAFTVWKTPEGKPGEKAPNKSKSEKLICRTAAAGIADLIQNGIQNKILLPDSQQLKASDIAVLVENHAQGAKIKKELSFAGIASSVSSASNVFTSRSAYYFASLLSTVLYPSSLENIKTLLLTPLFQVSFNGLMTLEQNEDERRKILDKLKKLQMISARQGFIPMISYFMSSENIYQKLLPLQGGERDLVNFIRISEILQSEIKNKKNLEEAQELLVKHMSDGSRIEEYQEGLESEEDRVRILTIHAAKGLEFPAVVCPFLMKSHQRKQDAWFLTFHENGAEKILFKNPLSEFSEENYAAAFKEQSSEARRLAYVALTRAKHANFTVACDYYQKDAENEPEFKMPGSLIMAKALQYAESKSELFAAIEPASAEISRMDSAALNDELSALNFTGRIPCRFTVASYSQLSDNRHTEDPLSAADRDSRRQQVILANRFPEIPPGNKSGDILHEFLEVLDFTKAQTSEAPVEITERHLPSARNIPVIAAAVLACCQNLTSAELMPGFFLNRLSQNKRLNEVEFHMTLRLTSGKKLPQIFSEAASAFLPARKKIAPSLFEGEIEGYLHGFIDMVFEHEGRYWIADWKSNSLPGYDPQSMADEMLSAQYDVQLLIYLLALRRHLRLRLGAQYSHGRHFGGALYIFLRGINPQKTGEGIFCAELSESTLDQFENEICGSGISQ